MDRSTTTPPIVIGCDLSRAWLDIHALPEGARSRIENTPSGIAGRVAGIDPVALVVFEATSGCDGPLIAALAERGIAFARVNPRQAREFARATGILARPTASTLRPGRDGQPPAPRGDEPARPGPVRLADFLRRRRQLVEIRKAEKARRHNAGQREILRDIESMIALLDRRIDKLDREIAALIAKSPSLAERARLLAPVPGIGPTVLATLLGVLPELGALCRRRIASLAGLAPHARESGTSRGRPPNPGRPAQGLRGPLHCRPHRHPAHPEPRRAPPVQANRRNGAATPSRPSAPTCVP